MQAILKAAGATLAILILVILAAPAMAERDGGRQKLDTDGDGYLSQDEFSVSKLSERADFSSLDADNDNRLSEDEIRNYVRENMRNRGRGLRSED